MMKFSIPVRKFHSGIEVMRKYVELTSVRYPHLKRGNYSVLSDRHLGFFQSLLSPYQVLTNDIAAYNVDWMNSVRGKKIYKNCLLEVTVEFLCFCMTRFKSTTPTSQEH